MFLDGILTSTMDNTKVPTLVINHTFSKIRFIKYIITFTKVIVPIMNFGNQNVEMDKFGMVHVDVGKIVVMGKILDLLRHSLMV